MKRRARGYNYAIAKYVNNKHTKLLSTYKFYANATEQYDKLIERNSVIFPKEYSYHNVKYNCDLVLYGFKGDNINKFINNKGLFQDVSFEDDSIKLKRITPIQTEDSFLWHHKDGKQRITFEELMKIINIKAEHFTIKAQITSNKISLEYFENDDIADIFVLKNQSDAERLFELLQYSCVAANISNVLFFYDNDRLEKIKLYDRLVKKLPISRDFLIRPYTH